MCWWCHSIGTLYYYETVKVYDIRKCSSMVLLCASFVPLLCWVSFIFDLVCYNCHNSRKPPFMHTAHMNLSRYCTGAPKSKALELSGRTSHFLWWSAPFVEGLTEHKKGTCSPFWSLCRTAWQTYKLSHINAFCISLSYQPKDQFMKFLQKDFENWKFWKT